MANKARVFYGERLAGYLERNDQGYSYAYDKTYLKSSDSKPISQTLPLSKYPYNSRVLFSFFDGLIPEGWLLNFATKHWKIKGTDRFELLITLCRDTIGAVTVLPVEEENG
ncbi:HipA N-terminal domain-containing protein [Pedobacter roseus]|jgi:serine/threonine-protein kinase HipA|uniref:HipA N-terminal domain-containing protein n=1 Tax=Pedobacter roseus TaxID=336820 RepID=A0A7G9QIJ4_9SPHI|nr:HipA N-terminal domain-containing protein [Pedobacter roseus]QNN43169.1 HipA N-terminal domain-containing protein [Pedobacter roseus]